MNTLAKAAQQAAYILRRLDRNGYVTDEDKSKISEAYLSLVESLAFSRCIETEGEAPCKTHSDAPPKREWVGLTDDEYEELLETKDWGGSLIAATEAKLKEKNT